MRVRARRSGSAMVRMQPCSRLAAGVSLRQTRDGPISNSIRARRKLAGCLLRNTRQVRQRGRGAELGPRANMVAFRHWNTAAQNGPVIQICSHCGALLLEDVENCSFCEAPLAEPADDSEPVAVSVSAPEGFHGATDTDDETNLSSAAEPEWRREVSRRLEAYRVRRGRARPDDSQTGLPFSRAATALEEDEGESEEIELYQRQRARAVQRPVQRAVQRAVQKKLQNERVEINIQPELDFTSFPDDRAHPQTALVPVASLAERRHAGALDLLFLALTYAGFLGLFRSLGGQLVLEKVDAIVYLAVFYLFYAQYFFLFTTFAGATPGMQLCGLTIVRLDGSLPDTRQLLWRSFGYLLSGATVMLGFLWSLWDEDRFTWQDRISQTYVTAAAPVMEASEFQVQPAQRQRFAHK
jgi:uncharacterized RDD family membrane protein YckC